jgi:hypothetical protein
MAKPAGLSAHTGSKAACIISQTGGKAACSIFNINQQSKQLYITYIADSVKNITV